MPEPADDGPRGPRFVKLYDDGLDRISKLLAMPGGKSVGELWLLLVKQCGHDNALVASRELLAEELGVTVKTISRASAALVEGGALAIHKSGTTNVYVLNENEVWKTAEVNKRFCSFRARTLLGFKENPGLRVRLSHLRPHQRELFDGVEETASEAVS